MVTFHSKIFIILKRYPACSASSGTHNPVIYATFQIELSILTCRYGDLTPITKMGKFLGMVWMLIGLVLTSIVIGNISSIFAIEFVFAPSSFATEDAVSVQYYKCTLSFIHSFIHSLKKYTRNSRLQNVMVSNLLAIFV